jgi:hypothetical protein
VRTKREIGSLFLLCALCTPGALGAGSHRGNHASNADLAVPLKRIPIRVYQGYLIVMEGQFGDASGPQNLILDTGTSPSIVNAHIVQKLAIPTFSGTVVAIGKAVATQYTILPEIEIGPLKAGPLRVAVADLSQVEHDLGISIGGIIGMDVLGNADFLVDYEEKSLQFGYAAKIGIPVPLDARTRVATVDVQIDSRRARMLVDTGSVGVVLLGGNFPDPQTFDLQLASQTGGSLAVEKAAIQAFSPGDIVLAGQHFQQKRAYFVPGRVDPQFDGLLGVRALGFRAISYNRERMTLYLVR